MPLTLKLLLAGKTAESFRFLFGTYIPLIVYHYYLYNIMSLYIYMVRKSLQRAVLLS